MLSHDSHQTILHLRERGEPGAHISRSLKFARKATIAKIQCIIQIRFWRMVDIVRVKKTTAWKDVPSPGV